MSLTLELWDLYTAQRQPLGCTVARGLPHPAGTYHIVVGVWVRDLRGNLLLTLRHPQKKQFPGLWENPGGSAQLGEDSRTAVRRELLEETGIEAAAADFVRLGSLTEKTALVDTYGLQLQAEKPAITLQPTETVDWRWVTQAELEKMANSETMSAASLRRKSALGTAFDAFCAGEKAD